MTLTHTLTSLARKMEVAEPTTIAGVQYHPRASEYVHLHPHGLHQWRWKRGAFPTPPKIAI